MELKDIEVVNSNALTKIESLKSLVKSEMAQGLYVSPKVKKGAALLNVASSKSMIRNSVRGSTASLGKSSYKSLSPQARMDLEREARINESQKKLVFHDFSVPLHIGKAKGLMSMPNSRKASKQRVDIISGKLQSDLMKIEEKNYSK